MEKAIVVVDEIYDFITGGSLECGHSEEAVAATKALIEKNPALPVLFICDHHPANHCSFAAQGGPWPPHCVAGTHGAEIHKDLLPFVSEELTFYKGCDPEQEQYSGFDGKNEAGQSLAEVLNLLGTEVVYVTGIATEYCVKNTAEDLLKAGFKVTVIEDCLGWVDAEGHKKTLPDLKSEGIRIQ
ncbi:MAG: isochorismatase family protein [Bacteroidales bacterium]|nr:isochorismatase family protein [Bacteroidales bacterium]